MSDLKTKRAAAGISGSVLCAKVGMSRSRLSQIERGYISPACEELERINKALDELIAAKLVIERVAASAGWPLAKGQTPKNERPPGKSMTIDQLNATLAERVMGWAVGPDRFMLGGRRWIPRWRFQPATRLEDASRLLERIAPQEYTMGVSPNGGFWARVRVAGVTGEASEPQQARAITFAIARAIGLELDSAE